MSRLKDYPTKEKSRLSSYPITFKSPTPNIDPNEAKKKATETMQMATDMRISIGQAEKNYQSFKDPLGMGLGPIWDEPDDKRSMQEILGYGVPENKARKAARMSIDNVNATQAIADAYFGGKDMLDVFKEKGRQDSLEPVTGSNFASDTLYKGIAVAAPMVQSIYEASPFAAMTMVGGGIIGFVSGNILGGAAPEELITIYGGAKAGLAAGTMFGGKLGIQAKSAEYWYRQGVGQMLYSMHQQGVDIKIAGPVAAVAGIPYAAIEYAQMSQLTPGLRKGVQDIGMRSMLQAFTVAAKKYGRTYVSENIEEVLQTGVEIAAEDIAAYLGESGQEQPGIPLRRTGFRRPGYKPGIFDKAGFISRANRLARTSVEAGQAMLLLPLPGAAVDVRTGMMQVKNKNNFIKAVQEVMGVPKEAAVLAADMLREGKSVKEVDQMLLQAKMVVEEQQEGEEAITDADVEAKPFKATVYRGTSKKTPVATGLAEGTHYSTDKKVAQSFAEDYGEGGKLVEKELTLENPYYLTDESMFGAEAEEVIKAEEKAGAVYSQNERDKRRSEIMRETLEAQGYDGIVYEDGKEIVAFEAQAKAQPAEKGKIVIRKGEVGEADVLARLNKEDSVYRGMTQAEYDATIGKGGGVESRGDFRAAEEGTNYAEEFADAESYVDFGRDDPRKTGKPNYIVEVKKGDNLTKTRRGDYEAGAEIPASQIGKVWKIEAVGDELIATELQPQAQAEATKVEKVETTTRRDAFNALSAHRDTRPSSIAKRFGKNGPTPEQEVAYKAEVKEWNKKDRALNKAFKAADLAEAKAMQRKATKVVTQKEVQAKKKKQRDILGGVDPIIQIHKALKEARAVRPLTEAAQKAERKRRVGAAAGAMKNFILHGMPIDEAVLRSTGLLKGELTGYKQLYDSIRESLDPGVENTAREMIVNHPDMRYFDITDTNKAFTKLLDGASITIREAELIEKVFGKTFEEQIAERKQKSGFMDLAITLWKAGLLTGIKTTGLNTFANMSHAVTETMASAVASPVDRVTSLFTGERANVFTLKGSLSGAKEGVIKGWNYMKTGQDERNIGAKLDYKAVYFGDSKTAKVLQAYEETVFHLLGAEDQPFYYGAKARSIASQAMAQAKNEKLKGKEYTARVKELMGAPTDEMLEYSVMDAEQAVFQNRTYLGDIAKDIQRSKLGEIIVPFGRTPAAVATQIINYTPIGTILEVSKQIHKGKFDQRMFTQATGRSVVGTGSLYIGAKLMAAGLMTLDHPDNERERELWKSEGRVANSVKVGGKWRSIQTLGPVGNVLLIGGYFQRELDKGGSPTKAFVTATAGGAKSFSEQTFVRGVNLAVDAIVQPERSFENWFSSMAGSLVPTIVADIARANDDIERRAVGPQQKVQKRIPFLREYLPPSIDVYGQDLPRYGGNVLETMIDPTRPSKIRQDVVVDEMRRLFDKGIKVSPTQLGDKAGYDILTPEENTHLWRRAGELTYSAIFNTINTPAYKEAGKGVELDPDYVKGQVIDMVVLGAKTTAKLELVKIKLAQGKTIMELAESGLYGIEEFKMMQYYSGEHQ